MSRSLPAPNTTLMQLTERSSFCRKGMCGVKTGHARTAISHHLQLTKSQNKKT